MRPNAGDSELTFPLFRLYGSTALPHPGECFSSWVFRLACESGLSSAKLRKYFHIDPRRPENMDFAPIDWQVINQLSQVAMIDSLAVADLVLPFIELIADPTYRCLTYDFDAGKPIVRFCPLCWQADSVAFVRRLWRLAYSQVCDEHAVLLSSCCGKCGAEVGLGIGDIEQHWAIRANPLRNCRQCGADLAGSRPLSLSLDRWQSLLHIQHQLHRVVSAGAIRHPRYGTISAANFLDSYLTLKDSAPNDRPIENNRYCFDLAKTVGVPMANFICELR